MSENAKSKAIAKSCWSLIIISRKSSLAFFTNLLFHVAILILNEYININSGSIDL